MKRQVCYVLFSSTSPSSLTYDTFSSLVARFSSTWARMLDFLSFSLPFTFLSFSFPCARAYSLSLVLVVTTSFGDPFLVRLFSFSFFILLFYAHIYIRWWSPSRLWLLSRLQQVCLDRCELIKIDCLFFSQDYCWRSFYSVMVNS